MLGWIWDKWFHFCIMPETYLDLHWTKRWIYGSCISSMFSLLRNFHTVLHFSLTQQFAGVLSLFILTNICYILNLLIIGIQTGMTWHIIMSYTCTSLISDIWHLFILLKIVLWRNVYSWPQFNVNKNELVALLLLL